MLLPIIFTIVIIVMKGMSTRGSLSCLLEVLWITHLKQAYQGFEVLSQCRRGKLTMYLISSHLFYHPPQVFEGRLNLGYGSRRSSCESQTYALLKDGLNLSRG